MYAREIDGQVYTFGNTGKLLRRSLVIYDHETNSEWSQVLGAAVTGPLTGTKLKLLPASRMTWKEWRERFPNTLALAKRPTRYDERSLEYYNRLASRLVVGLTFQEPPVGYSYSMLREQPVLNETVAGTPILITFSAKTISVGVFDRTLGDQTLTFTAFDGDDHKVKDTETGSKWDTLTGIAVAGPSKGRALTKMAYVTAFTDRWKHNYPNTTVYGE